MVDVVGGTGVGSGVGEGVGSGVGTGVGGGLGSGSWVRCRSGVDIGL